MSQTNIIIALTGGLIASFSPCILPMIPVYIAVITGYSATEIIENKAKKSDIILKLIFFILGFTLLFTLMGLTASSIGIFIGTHIITIKKIVGILLIVWGMKLAGIIDMNFIERRLTKFFSPITKIKARSGIFGAFIMGVAFSLSWSPCVSATLLPILTLAANEETITKGMILLFFYSMGIAIPIVVIGLGATGLLKMVIQKRMVHRYIEVIGGFMVMLYGVYLIMGK